MSEKKHNSDFSFEYYFNESDIFSYIIVSKLIVGYLRKIHGGVEDYVDVCPIFGLYWNWWGQKEFSRVGGGELTVGELGNQVKVGGERDQYNNIRKAPYNTSDCIVTRA